MTNEKNLYYLDELSGYKVADDDCDVRGWEVVDRDGRTIGTVDGLLVSKKAEKVVYLDVEVARELIGKDHETYTVQANEGAHEFLNKDGENHFILPVGLVDLNEDGKKVLANQTSYDMISNTKKFGKGTDINREYELSAIRSYHPTTAENYRSPIDEHFYEGREFENKLRRKYK